MTKEYTIDVDKKEYVVLATSEEEAIELVLKRVKKEIKSKFL